MNMIKIWISANKLTHTYLTNYVFFQCTKSKADDLGDQFIIGH
eukprot:UN12931